MGKYSLSIPIPLVQVPIGEEVVPVLQMSDWGKWLLEQNLWHRLCGLSEPNLDLCDKIWGSFWNKYQQLNPSHELFQRTDISLNRCCGLLLHGDEGRTLKKSAVLIMACHSILGFGLSTSDSKLKKTELHKLNYERPSWTTRFLQAVLPKMFYSSDDGSEVDGFQDLMRHITTDLRSLYDTGLCDRSGRRYWFVVLNLVGDWPFIGRAGCLSRTFLNISKHPKAKAKPKGICHRCLADQEGYPWEDWTSENPAWVESINTVSPYAREPALLSLPMNRNDTTAFFAWDLFHAWHIGAGKVFLASAIICLAMSCIFDDQRSVDGRLTCVSDSFLQWCKEKKISPNIRKISKENMGWMTTGSYPHGTWSKGSTTTALLKWFLHVCRQHLNAVHEDQLLCAAFEAANHMNEFLSGLYRRELFIPSELALNLVEHGFAFLRGFGKCVSIAYHSKRALFIQMPNYHRIHELLRDLKIHAQCAAAVISPLAYATQVDEDFIGRPSRISRRVSWRLVIDRTLRRSLLTAYSKYVKEGIIRKEAPKWYNSCFCLQTWKLFVLAWIVLKKCAAS